MPLYKGQRLEDLDDETLTQAADEACEGMKKAFLHYATCEAFMLEIAEVLKARTERLH